MIDFLTISIDRAKVSTDRNTEFRIFILKFSKLEFSLYQLYETIFSKLKYHYYNLSMYIPIYTIEDASYESLANSLTHHEHLGRT